MVVYSNVCTFSTTYMTLWIAPSLLLPSSPACVSFATPVELSWPATGIRQIA